MKKDKITVILKVTNQCNLSCPYCYNYSNLKKNEKLKIEDFENIIFKVFKEYNNVNLIFHGGEPTLMGLDWYKKAIDILNIYKEKMNIKSLSLGMQTNFTIQDDELFEFLFSNKIGIGTSFDGLENKKTRVKTKEYLNNLEKFKEEKIDCITILTNENCKNIEKQIEYFENLNLESVKFNRVYKTKTMNKNYSDFNNDEIVDFYFKLFLYCLNKEETKFDINFKNYLNMLSIKNKSLLCQYENCLNKWISFQPNGDCYQCGQEWEQNEDYKFGNILNSESLEKIYNSKEYAEFSNEISKSRKTCKEDCEIFEFCQGYCPAKRLAATGNLIKKDEAHCKFLESILKKIINELKISEIKNKNFIDWIGLNE